MRSKLLIVWYTVLAALLLELVLYGLTGLVISLHKRSRYEAFSKQAAVWQPVGDEPYASYINQFAKQYQVSAKLVAAVIQAESSFEPKAVSKSGAFGLMQIIPSTWKDMNDRLGICRGRHAGECSISCYQNPELNIHVGTAYLRQLLQHYSGNAVMAVAAYNAGPGTVDRAGGVPDIKETQEYVERVISNWQGRTPGLPEDVLRQGQVWSGIQRSLERVLLFTAALWLVTLYCLFRYYRSWRWR